MVLIILTAQQFLTFDDICCLHTVLIYLNINTVKRSYRVGNTMRILLSQKYFLLKMIHLQVKYQLKYFS